MLVILFFLFLVVATVDDSCEYITLDSNNSCCLLIWKVQNQSLVIVVVNKDIDYSRYQELMKSHLRMISQGNRLFIYYYCFTLSHLVMVVCMLYSNIPLLSR